MIVAGEASGDMHGAHLIKTIHALDPQIVFSGVGGRRMEEAGVHIDYYLADLAVVGFTEVIRNYFEIRKVFHLIVQEALLRKVDAVILIDFPGFNLRLAKELKKHHIKIIYYISPQVWAWKENRVEIVKKYIDKIIVFFPFEKNLYQKHGIEATCVGHPLLDTMTLKKDRKDLLSSVNFDHKKPIIGILPGSRKKEIERLLPVMLNSAEIIHRQYPQTQFLLLRALSLDTSFFEPYIQNKNIPLKIISDYYYEGINACNVCIVASGTATLETAILKKPMVIVYKTSLLTWILAKLFIKIPYIGLVNVVAGKKIVPECIQFEATSTSIALEISKILTEKRSSEMKVALEKIKHILGDQGALERAAKEVLAAL